MFFLTKLLAAMPFGNFLRGTLGKIVLGGLIVLLGFIGFKLWLSSYEDRILEQALADFNQAQIIALEEARAEYERQLAEIEADQEARIAELERERAELVEQADELIDRLRFGDLDGNGQPSSEILRETVRELQRRAGGS